MPSVEVGVSGSPALRKGVVLIRYSVSSLDQISFSFLSLGIALNLENGNVWLDSFFFPLSQIGCLIRAWIRFVFNGRGSKVRQWKEQDFFHALNGRPFSRKQPKKRLIAMRKEWGEVRRAPPLKRHLAFINKLSKGDALFLRATRKEGCRPNDRLGGTAAGRADL